MKLKKCTRCGKVLPSTTEYFYKSKAGKNGLYASCKDCIKTYQKEYYSRPLPEEKTTERYLILDECKKKILSKYFEGQVVNLRYRDTKEEIISRKKAKIIKFYPHHVLCLVDNCRECFTYQGLHNLTTYKKGEK